VTFVVVVFSAVVRRRFVDDLVSTLSVNLALPKEVMFSFWWLSGWIARLSVS